jgi:hypothetical protein
MRDQKLVTLALHFGKIDYLPLAENFLKSLLMCVTYTNIELMLVETGENRTVRKWFEDLDFSTNFITHAGIKTDIVCNPGCNIQKSLVFLDPEPQDEWYMSFSKGIAEAIKQARGEYFVILAEDNQFNVKGPIIQSYIDVLELKENEKSFVHFMTQHQYKYHKNNNRHKGPFENNGFKYFQVEKTKECTKWCPFGLTKLKNYDLLGGFPIPKLNEPSNIPQITLSQKAHSLKMSRLYPLVSHGVWFHNNDRRKFVENILEKSRVNPNYVLYPIHDYNEIKKVVISQPLSTDNFRL